MIIVDTNTEPTLYEHVKKFHKTHDPCRCLHIKHEHFGQDPDQFISHFTDSIQKFFKDELFITEDGQIFISDDRDVFVMTQNTPRKSLTRFIAHISPQLSPVSPDEKPASLFETGLNWNDLMAVCMGKMKVFTAQQQKALAEQKAQDTQKERQRLLDMNIHKEHVKTIAARREKREEVNVLIVEDDVFSQTLVKGTVGKSYPVVGAKNGFEAITLYADKAPDIMFLDIDLPDITGHDVLGKILKMDPQAYIVMLSGNGDKDNVLQAVQGGAKGFVGKPFTREKLFQYIQKSPHVLHKTTL